jgi:hypothetical protein
MTSSGKSITLSAPPRTRALPSSDEIGTNVCVTFVKSCNSCLAASPQRGSNRASLKFHRRLLRYTLWCPPDRPHPSSNPHLDTPSTPLKKIQPVLWTASHSYVEHWFPCHFQDRSPRQHPDVSSQDSSTFSFQR